jgi:lysophospholipase L1-like esterase
MILYAAIGDSLTVGAGDRSGRGFVPLYANFTQQSLNNNVGFENLGMSGATTADILLLVTSSSDVRAVLRKSEIITITAGGNDLVNAAKTYLANKDMGVFQKALIKCKQNFAGIISAIRNIKNGQTYIIRAVDLYNPFPTIPQTNQWVQKFNQHIESFENGQLKVANIFKLFQGREKEFISSDDFHPNAQGYQVIANELKKQGYKPIR